MKDQGWWNGFDPFCDIMHMKILGRVSDMNNLRL